MNQEKIIKSVRQWLESLVIEMNLCPFAKRELVKNSVRFAVTGATNELQLLTALEDELELLNRDASIETILLAHPDVLQDFDDYNQFLSDADQLLVSMELEGIYQIASFHPDYQFAGTQPDDAENYTNRSPYPLLHLLREDSLESAIKEYPDIDQVPARNIAMMNRMGKDKLSALLQACFKRH
ncbi:MAG: DUF1415 domain-containing protein [Gammaproteobacteria bacterium]|nr:DUF1415 domain-containing protein [Gammaproteobacteria bacterium]